MSVVEKSKIKIKFEVFHRSDSPLAIYILVSATGRSLRLQLRLYHGLHGGRPICRRLYGCRAGPVHSPELVDEVLDDETV